MGKIDWSALLSASSYTWELQRPGATESEIASLEAYCGHSLPSLYVSFLRFCDGGAIWYKREAYLRLWSSHDIPAWFTAYGFTDSEMPGALPFADDGGPECLVFDLRTEHEYHEYPILGVDFTIVRWQEAFPVAKTFAEFLQLRLHVPLNNIM